MLAATYRQLICIWFSASGVYCGRSFSHISSKGESTNCKLAAEFGLISALNGCNTLGQVKRVHCNLIRRGFDQSSFVLAKVVRVLTTFNIPMESYSRPLLDQVHRPNSFLYTAVIRGYSLRGSTQQAFILYSRMRKTQIQPLTFTFSALFKVSALDSDVRVGSQIHAQAMLLGGFDLDLYSNNTLMDMYIKCGALGDARKVFDEMPQRDVISWTELIVGYTKVGDMDEAGELFHIFEEKDTVGWTVMITGHAQNSRPRDALRIFEQMRAAGVEADEVTLVGAVSACAQLGSLKYAHSISDVVRRAGFYQNVILGSAMIDMFAKCGSVDEAWGVFCCMKEKNVYTYSAMIVGLAMHGRAQSAMQLFDEMIRTEAKPNYVTFIGVLTACSHAGNVDQGKHYYAVMQEQYGISPTADHYACMVDLLGRAGHVEEAYDLITAMPPDVKPHEGVWGALLGACKSYSRPHIAKIAASHLFELEPAAVGNYLLLSNIYASTGQWEEVARVRKLMKEKGLKKNPGLSFVEARDGMLHEFFAGDQTHPLTKEIMAVLEQLIERVNQEGHSPLLRSVPYDVADYDKELLLKMHSEKLVLSFGLINSKPGCAIRITKNIRICEDCHSLGHPGLLAIRLWSEIR